MSVSTLLWLAMEYRTAHTQMLMKKDAVSHVSSTWCDIVRCVLDMHALCLKHNCYNIFEYWDLDNPFYMRAGGPILLHLVNPHALVCVI